MRVLLVYPEFPISYWGFQHSLPLLKRRATLPPLGLISVAALLPSSWDLRLVDMNVQALTDEDLRWSEVVLTSGMLVQETAMHDIIRRAKALERRTVVGGPGVTTSPERFEDADALILGEVEGRVEEMIAAIEARPNTPRVLEAPENRPSLHDVPVPRFDLLDVKQYRSMAIQTSRGCPFSCEFCDIIEIFGRVPRVKQATQIIAELEALRKLGYSGEVFVVDDNFIGNKKAVKPILVELARWQKEANYPFNFYTEASLNLAKDDKLIEAMRAAQFTSVFIGIETTDAAALKKTQKKQNVGVDVRDALDKLLESGMEVMAGFIVGLDGDGPESFDAQRELLYDAPLPLAMMNLLTALPSTQLWRRLDREGRLRTHSDGDAFARPNYVPTMNEHVLLEGYSKLLADLYTPEAFYRRSTALVDKIRQPANPSPLLLEDIGIALRSLYQLGLVSKRRSNFWRLLGHALPRGRHAVHTAIACAVRGEHMIRYTEEFVIPRLAESLRLVDAEPPVVAPKRVFLPVIESQSKLSA